MNRPPAQLVTMLLILAAAVIPAVTVTGLVGLVLGLILDYPLGVGQVRALALIMAGAGLLLITHLLDRQAIARTVLSCHPLAAALTGPLTPSQPVATPPQLIGGRR